MPWLLVPENPRLLDVKATNANMSNKNYDDKLGIREAEGRCACNCSGSLPINDTARHDDREVG